MSNFPTPAVPQADYIAWYRLWTKVNALPECKCVESPNNAVCGIEGFGEGLKYRFEKVIGGGRPCYRVWQDSEHCPESYESMTLITFSAFFEVLELATV